ncbi:MAG: hypothetical protein AAB539_02870, partial [Patescibacteria group bacterium]
SGAHLRPTRAMATGSSRKASRMAAVDAMKSQPMGTAPPAHVSESAELRAAKTYISGSPNCTSQICRSYSRRIVALAQDIDRIL